MKSVPSLLAGIACIGVFMSSAPAKDPDREKISWTLPDHTRVEFYHKPPPAWSDHPKCLDLIVPNRVVHYEFAESHSGYQNVDLYINEDHSVVWLVDRRDNQIGLTVYLRTKEFEVETIGKTFDASNQHAKIVPMDG